MVVLLEEGLARLILALGKGVPPLVGRGSSPIQVLHHLLHVHTFDGVSFNVLVRVDSRASEDIFPRYLV
jgi:hypothetical protein